MSQIDAIVKSFKEIVATTGDLNSALPGDLQYGDRVNLDAPKPFASLTIKEVTRVGNSSGRSLVDYLVTMSVYVLEDVEILGPIMRLFHVHFDRRRVLPGLVAEEAKCVLVFPAGADKITESEDEELGKAILIGEAAWFVKLNER